SDCLFELGQRIHHIGFHAQSTVPKSAQGQLDVRRVVLQQQHADRSFLRLVEIERCVHACSSRFVREKAASGALALMSSQYSPNSRTVSRKLSKSTGFWI